MLHPKLRGQSNFTIYARYTELTKCQKYLGLHITDTHVKKNCEALVEEALKSFYYMKRNI